jgi:predicted MPP superfamily phosphohydrolase
VVKLIEVAIFSDAHYASENTRKVEDESFFPLIVEKLSSEKKKEDYVKKWCFLMQKAFGRFLEKAKLGSFDMIISLGDNISGALPGGPVTQEIQAEWREYKKLIADTFPKISKESAKYLWGGHDIKFGDMLTDLHGLKGGEMTKKSFEAAEKFIGNPWFCKKMEKFMLLGLNSEIIYSSIEKINPDQEFFIEKAKEQEKFIQEYLENASKNNNKVILLIHDPVQLKELQEILEPHKKNIVLVLAGHIHSPAVWKIYCLLSKIVKIFKIRIETPQQITPKQKVIKSVIQEMAEIYPIIQSYNIKIVPAIWGQMPLARQQRIIGRGGYAILTLNNGQFSLKRYKL